MSQKMSWILYIVLHLSFKADGLKCRVCNNAEWSPNQQYYAGRCEKELDPGNLETHCSVEGTQFCLKLKITFDPKVKRRTELLEKNLESVLSERDKDEILKVLKSQQTVYTQEGVLRGCANLTGSFEDKKEN